MECMAQFATNCRGPCFGLCLHYINMEHRACHPSTGTQPDYIRSTKKALIFILVHPDRDKIVPCMLTDASQKNKKKARINSVSLLPLHRVGN